MVSSKRLMLGIGIGVVFAIAAYEVALPMYAAHGYKGRIATAARQLQPKLSGVVATTKRPIFNAASTTLSSNKDDIDATQDVIIKAQTSLANFKKIANSLTHLPFTG